MRESRLSGSVEGVMGNHDPYSDNTHLRQYGTHKHPAVKEWLAAHPRIYLHFTQAARRGLT